MPPVSDDQGGKPQRREGDTALLVEALTDHLQDAVPPLIGGKVGELYEVLQLPASEDILARFAEEAHTLIVSRTVPDSELEEGDSATATTETDDEDKPPAFELSLQIGFDTDGPVTKSWPKASVIFTKRNKGLTVETDLSSQLRTYSFSDGPAFETLHAMYHDVFVPLLRSAMEVHRVGDKIGIKAVKKSIGHLEMTLNHLQQDTDIPDVNLVFYPRIVDVVEQAQAQGRHPHLDDLGPDWDTDTVLLNGLEKCVKKWSRDLSKIVELASAERTITTASDEISFWLELERKLQTIKEVKGLPEVHLTLEALRATKRQFQVTNFESSTDVEDTLDRVSKYSAVMQGFPNQIAATDLDQLAGAVFEIFDHLQKKMKNSTYPLDRANMLAQAIASDLHARLQKTLSEEPLLQLRFKEFVKLDDACTALFEAWEKHYKSFYNDVLLDRKRDRPKTAIRRFVPDFKPLRDRLEAISKLRREHHKLRSTVQKVLEPDGRAPATAAATALPATEGEAAEPAEAPPSFVAKIDEAYAEFKSIDALDVSDSGTRTWKDCNARYSEKIQAVEASIADLLSNQLHQASSSNDMFRICREFNPLFFRRGIHSAIQDYQSQLIQRVKDDIKSLHDKFKIRFDRTTNKTMSAIRGLPPVSSQIIWAKQIERQLEGHLAKVEDVLGKSWQNHLEGRQLKEDGDSFKAMLDTKELFEEWLLEISDRPLMAQGSMFDVDIVHMGDVSNYTLKVNFPEQFIALAREIKTLTWLGNKYGFKVPIKRISYAKGIERQFPNAIRLKESLKTFRRALATIHEHPTYAPLINGHLNRCHEVIHHGFEVEWKEQHSAEAFAQEFADVVNQLNEKTNDLLSFREKVEGFLQDLEKCPTSAPAIQANLKALQKVVDQLEIDGYCNIALWVSDIDHKVEQRLAKKLNKALAKWTAALRHVGTEPHGATSEDELVISIQPIVHSFQMIDDEMSLHPPLEDVRTQLVHQLEKFVGQIAGQKRLHAPDFDPKDPAVVRSDLQYSRLKSQLPGGDAELVKAYEAIEATCAGSKQFVTEWLQYQALWNMNADDVATRFGKDMVSWQQLLTQIKKAKRSIDTPETSRSFGAITINYAQVQARVSIKYDEIHRDLLGTFGSQLGERMNAWYSEVSQAKATLERLAVESGDTKQAINAISKLQDIKKNMPDWSESFASFQKSYPILRSQRYNFPEGWVELENAAAKWNDLETMVGRKDAIVQKQMGSLQDKIQTQDRTVDRMINDTLRDWANEKPVGGDTRPDEALRIIDRYEEQLRELQGELDSLKVARGALDMKPKDETRIEKCMEELLELKSSWGELREVWLRIEDIRSIPWPAVVIQRVRAKIDGITSSMKKMPALTRSQPAYEATHTMLERALRTNRLIDAIKSEAIKDRHWAAICKVLQVSWNKSTLTLGDVWDADILSKDKAVLEIVGQAQGEMALEQFLRDLRTEWDAYELSLVNYQNRTKLITKWDDLFNKCKEHLQSLNSMKGSAFFKAFEADANSWDDKLTKVNTMFDVWLDVQRRWIYLEGVFTGSQDIKTMLPQASSMFMSINNDFLGLMKKVSKAPNVMDVIAIPGAHELLNKMLDKLGKVEKDLRDYLEKERRKFPRFYFVGDEDLLDIIGNAKNVDKLQKHFKKMFAGISEVALNEDGTECVGVLSREAERVDYKTNVKIAGRKINEWLEGVESEMRSSMAALLAEATIAVGRFREQGFQLEPYMQWLDQFQGQLVVLAAQVSWSQVTESALRGGTAAGLETVRDGVVKTLVALADLVLKYHPVVRRKKLEQMITELVHQRDVTKQLKEDGVSSPKDFLWLQQMRFYFDPNKSNAMEKLTIQMADANFFYGFEYLGLIDKLVQTPLTDRCYLTLTQALQAKQGAAPFGPAGTGKTESVKALGAQLGRFVLVFNCDETFDFLAMGRIFVGLCQVGAWGCFDEFNRLEERMLSAVSQQIQNIQVALKKGPPAPGEPMMVELLGREIAVHPDVGLFITMNPGYAGRSNLPDNLKKLFRNMAMTVPDRQLIAQVMLYSQGFRSAEELSRKVVPLFILCKEQLSSQSHYDFGLRSLKSVLVSSGNIKRERLAQAREALEASGKKVDEDELSTHIDEQDVLITAICQTMVPKMVAEDIPLLNSLLSDVFPGKEYRPLALDDLKAKILEVMDEWHYVRSETFLLKVLQVYQVTCINHGLMLVGPTGVGKSAAWKILNEALTRLTGEEGQVYIIDPKAISKDELYGNMDENTREWTDGLFTHIVRKVIDNHRGELTRRQWIVFDGDVDPEWVENLNSVLDDNKLLTLPNGERLNLPSKIRIIFEVQDLKNATLATVSRCGMIWFSDDVLSTDMYFQRYLLQLRNEPLEKDTIGLKKEEEHPIMEIQRKVAGVYQPFFEPTGLIPRALAHGHHVGHIMDFTFMRSIHSLLGMLNKIVRTIYDYNQQYEDFPMTDSQIQSYASKRLVYAVVWSIVGDARGSVRSEMSQFIDQESDIPMPNGDVIDYEVTIPEGEWSPWKDKVLTVELEGGSFMGTDVVVPTLDTIRHEDLLQTWLAEHMPIVLCGPPGSGKTMTLFSALRALPHIEVVGLNFSNETKPDLIMKTLEQYCEYFKSPTGTVLQPKEVGKWVIIFCDECNLPAADKYDTVRVITFIRQLVEQNGFWHPVDKTFITLNRIQFVGACNPPTDPGRVPLNPRMLRHIPVVYVDYPTAESYTMIYGTFNRAVLRTKPSIAQYGDTLTEAMVDFFMETQKRFTADMQPHYVYSPREMTRWYKGVGEALIPLAEPTVEDLVRIWAHEALRLFNDRLVEEEERVWTEAQIDAVAKKHFPECDCEKALQRPILFSTWLNDEELYLPVGQDDLRECLRGKLRVFCEEELSVELVLFNDVLDHVLRIDRVFRQNQGHVLLIGISGAGKTTMAKFVAWMNHMEIFQVKIHNRYQTKDFDEDLRTVLRAAGTKNKKIAFIMDEGNGLDTAFLERMNTLLANGEVPGLFEGEEYAALMSACKSAAREYDNKTIEDNDDLYKWFSKTVMKNLHVVFTMNPSEGGLQDRATTSPALFNRCVLNWVGDWSENAYFSVAHEFTNKIPLPEDKFEAPSGVDKVTTEQLPDPLTYKAALVNACVYVHKSGQAISKRLRKREGRTVHITPRHFVEFINQMTTVFAKKRGDLDEQKSHLESGLQKIKDTLDQVEELGAQLEVSKRELEAKQKETEQNWESISQEERQAGALKEEASKLGEMCKVEKAKAETKRNEVAEELAQAEPAEIAAKEAVEKIMTKKGQTAMKGLLKLGNPPPTVQLVISAAVFLITKKKLETDWKKCKSAASGADFFQDLKYLLDRLNPQSDVTPKKKMGEKDLAHVKKLFLSDKKWTEQAMESASKDALPLMHWVEAIYKYAACVNNVEPNRQLLVELETEVAEKEAKQAEAEQKVIDLETRIRDLKVGLQRLSEETAELKHSMTQATARAQRSSTLLDSLSVERERWKKTAEGFEEQMATLVGDGFLSGAFIAYAGYFDQNYRQGLMKLWKTFLSRSNIGFKSDLSLPDYLATADDRLEWKTNSLPEDVVCYENAVMLEQHQRYPLVIDPSGQAVEFLLKQYKGIEKTSFLDANFRKKLKDALCFGKFLLVQEAENFDSVLNPVLNREIKRTAGRMLVGIADSEVDLSPEFRIILSARDASHQFPSDLCSRVTMVNFTVTAASLQSQCQSQVLKSERPDKEEERSEQLKLQGAFRLQLLRLEKSLLNSLNEAEGSILDDDKVIGELQRLKKESTEVEVKKNATDQVMKEIDAILDEYKPIAQKCSAIYFTLEQMSDVHFLYRFSLAFFFDIFKTVLHHNPHLQGVSDYGKRLEIITQDLLKTTYDRVSPGMLHEHRMAFAVILATIKAAGTQAELPEAEFNYFLSGGGGVLSQENDFAFLKALNDDQARKLHSLGRSVDAFKGLVADIKRNESKFVQWMQTTIAEEQIPDVEAVKGAGKLRSWRQLMLLQAVRPDRVLAMSHLYVEELLGKGFASSGHDDSKVLELAVLQEITAKTPVLLCGASGYDPSTNVNDLCDVLQKQCKQIALGSSEAFDQADKAISGAASSGNWVMLKNVHLAPTWLTSLEKKLSTMTPHPDFRLFLTSEINPKLPVNLLRASKLFVYEPAAGIKAGLLRTLSSLTATKLNAKPAQRSRIYLLLAWFHAVTQERLRYTPLGWSKVYEFGEADLRNAADTIDKWIDEAAAGRASIESRDVPWAALQALLTQTCYGGRVDNDIDRQLLASFIKTFFQSNSLNSDFELVRADSLTATPSIKAPPLGNADQLFAWVSSLPNTQTPTWLSLPANAEVVLLAKRAGAFVNQLAALQTTTAEEEDFSKENVIAAETGASMTGIPHWMKEIATTCEQWMTLLPDAISPVTRTEDSIKDPMFRFFEREITMGSSLLKRVRKDVQDVADACHGKIKQTNDLRHLMHDLRHQHVPKSWQTYTIPPGLSAGLWMLDFVERCRQLETFSTAGASAAALRGLKVWLGGLFNPEAYITATRQAVAQANQWSLERLVLQIDCRSSESDLPSDMDRAFQITGLRLEGAGAKGATLSLSSEPFSKLPMTILRWNDSGAGSEVSGPIVELPVYLNATRGQIIFKIKMTPGAGTTSDTFYQRGVALLCSSLSGSV